MGVNNSLLGKLHTFANRKAQLVTRLPICELEITTLGTNTIGQLYTIINHHKKVVGYGISLDKDWFYTNTNNPRKIKRIICHEIAHITEPMDHSEKFKRVARGLGAGDNIGETIADSAKTKEG